MDQWRGRQVEEVHQAGIINGDIYVPSENVPVKWTDPDCKNEVCGRSAQELKEDPGTHCAVSLIPQRTWARSKEHLRQVIAEL